MNDKLELKGYHCKTCGKKLFEGDYIGIVSIKCNRCKNINIFEEKIQSEEKL